MKTVLLIALTILASQFAHAGGDIAAGAVKSKPCAACHGADFNTPVSADIPRLAGQHADYLAIALKSFQDGSRNHAVMTSVAKTLSASDIDNLAAYYASASCK